MFSSIQLVIEFHNPYSSRELDIFNKINKNHVLIHFHGNNSAGVRDHKGILIPNVFECTYIHKKYYTCELIPNNEPLPSNIDMKNSIYRDDINLNYPPFVN